MLNGAKRFIGNAGLSDVYVVFARTGDDGAKGISAFLVDGHADGVSSEPLRTMGMPGWQLGAPRFEDVEIPAGGHVVGTGRVDLTQPLIFSADETTDIGNDGMPSAPTPARFNGHLDVVQIVVGEDDPSYLVPTDVARLATARR